MARGFTWFDADGGTLNLNSVPETGAAEGLGVEAGVRGLEMPPVELVADEIPLQDGARERNLKILPRDVDLPLFMRSASVGGLRTLARTVRRALSPRRGNGRLRVLTVDGLTFDLTCRYVGGWNGDESADTYGNNWQSCLLQFRALDPYFYSTVPSTTVFGVLGGVTTFFPLLPLTLAVSSLTGDNTVVNAGDVEAFPIWTLTGPADTLQLENLTADPVSSFTVNPALIGHDPLALGEQIVIDTRFGHKTVVGPGALNYYGALASGSYLWPLLAGTQTIRITVTGATIDTTLTLSFTPRFLGL